MDTSEALQLLKAVDRVLPNIQSYLSQVLKQENLSLEAEALRARYEAMLASLEKASREPLPITPPTGRMYRHSLAPPDTGRHKVIMHNRRKTEGDFSQFNYSTQQQRSGSQEGLEVIPEKPIEVPEISGPLLWRDDHKRWHRRHCRLVPSQRTLSIYETPDEVALLESISLVGARALFELTADECDDRDLCFIVEAAGIITDDTFIRHLFAAYSEGDFTKWKTTLEEVVSRSRPTSQWAESVVSSTSLGHDSIFSVISSGEEMKQYSPLIENDEDGNVSDATIYEDIDELVQQFDQTMQKTAEAIQSLDPKKSKKINNKNKVLAKHRQQLETGAYYEGFLYKRAGNSWKKKWCQIRGCIFSYSKNPEDSSTHDYVLLRADVIAVKDAKKSFAFKLSCKGVKEIYLATDEEEEQLRWMSKLQAASKRDNEFPLLAAYSSKNKKPEALPEGIYNVPRNSLHDEALYDEPPLELIIANSNTTAAAGGDVGGGVYDVPRHLNEGSQTIVSSEGVEFHMTGNPFDLYDVPRASLQYLDDETIYDYPLDLDIDDMEIYDYPPDATELGILEVETESQGSGGIRESGSDSSNSYTPVSNDALSTSSNRHSNIESLGSSEDMSFSTLISDGYRSLPHNTSQQVESFLSSIIETAATNTPTPFSSNNTPTHEFGHILIRGNLLKKDRLKWTKCYCIIRNSFLECHKSSASANTSKPMMKLLLLGSQVMSLQDGKRQWAFQLKHPRREGAVTFAAENEIDYKHWMEAFQNASSIQVQKVDTMEEIRIPDGDLKRKWRSLERGLKDQDTPPQKLKEYSGRSSPAEFDEDGTPVKNRRRLTWSKPGISKSAGNINQRVKSVAATDLQRDEIFSRKIIGSNETIDGTNRLTKTTSAVLLPQKPDTVPLNPSQRVISPGGIPCFQGYLRVKNSKEEKWYRYWCVLENMKIRCHSSQRNLTLATDVYLSGCTIARADDETKRRYTFRVWNSETLDCTYFSAGDEDEFTSWFHEVIKGAEKVTSSNAPPIIYFYPPKDKPTPPPHQRAPPTDNGMTPLPQGVLHQGALKKRSDKGQWHLHFCRLKETHLYVYHSTTDTTPITVLAIQHCIVEKVNIPNESEKHIFNVSVKGGKTHVFAASNEVEIQSWLNILQECIGKGMSPQMRTRSGSRSNKDKPKDIQRKSPLLSSHEKKHEDLISHVPAADLTNCAHSGYCEVQLKTLGSPWVRHWCILYENVLYIYHNQESLSTVKTVVLPGYNIETLAAAAKKPFGMSLSHADAPSVNLAANDQVDFTRWFMSLEASSKSEIPPAAAAVKHMNNDIPPDSPSTKPKEKVQPETPPTVPSQNGDSKELSLTGQQQAYIKDRSSTASHFEKRIKKTQKVSQTTEQNLQNQYKQMKIMQEKFSEHIKRLETLPNITETSKRKVKEMKVKVAQINKILPYLDKYITVNRQAELQTVAILKETCAVKLQELEQEFRKNNKGINPSLLIPTAKMSRKEKTQSLPGGMGDYNSLARGRKSKKNKKSSVTSPTPTKVETTPNEVKVEDGNVQSVSPSGSSGSSEQSHEQAEPNDTHTINEEITEPTYDVVQRVMEKPKDTPIASEHYVELLHPRTVYPAQKQSEDSSIHYACVTPRLTPPTPATNSNKDKINHPVTNYSELLLVSKADNTLDGDATDDNLMSESSFNKYIDNIFEQFGSATPTANNDKLTISDTQFSKSPDLPSRNGLKHISVPPPTVPPPPPPTSPSPPPSTAPSQSLPIAPPTHSPSLTPPTSPPTKDTKPPAVPLKPIRSSSSTTNTTSSLAVSSSSPSFPRKSTSPSPPTYPKPNKTNKMSSPPPPTKSKPKRVRSNTVPLAESTSKPFEESAVSLSSPAREEVALLSKSGTSLAERMKAFQ